jgi:hypothetical protein
MVAWLLSVLVVTAAPTRIAAPGLTSPNLDEKTTRYYSDALVQRLTEAGLEVTSGSQLQQVLGLERQKQLLGCSDGGACLVELAQALGVDGVMVGSLGRFDDVYQLNVRIVSSKDGTPLAVQTARVKGSEALNDVLVDVARKLAEALRPDLTPRRPVLALIPAVGGLVLGGVATGLLVSGENRRAALRSGNEMVVGASPTTFAQSASLELTAGVITASAGGALVVGAIIWWLVGAPAEATPVVSLGAGGVNFGLQVRLP